MFAPSRRCAFSHPCVRSHYLASIYIAPIRRRLTKSDRPPASSQWIPPPFSIWDRLGISYFFDFVSPARVLFPITKRRLLNIIGLLRTVKRRPKLPGPLAKVLNVKKSEPFQDPSKSLEPAPLKKGQFLLQKQEYGGSFWPVAYGGATTRHFGAFQKVLNVKKFGALTEPFRAPDFASLKRGFPCNEKYNGSARPAFCLQRSTYPSFLGHFQKY